MPMKITGKFNENCSKSIEMKMTGASPNKIHRGKPQGELQKRNPGQAPEVVLNDFKIDKNLTLSFDDKMTCFGTLMPNASLEGRPPSCRLPRWWSGNWNVDDWGCRRRWWPRICTGDVADEGGCLVEHLHPIQPLRSTRGLRRCGDRDEQPGVGEPESSDRAAFSHPGQDVGE